MFSLRRRKNIMQEWNVLQSFRSMTSNFCLTQTNTQTNIAVFECFCIEITRHSETTDKFYSVIPWNQFIDSVWFCFFFLAWNVWQQLFIQVLTFLLINQFNENGYCFKAGQWNAKKNILNFGPINLSCGLCHYWLLCRIFYYACT